MRGNRKAPPRGRTISEDEAALWNYATRKLERVRAKLRVPTENQAAEDSLPILGPPVARLPDERPQPESSTKPPRPFRSAKPPGGTTAPLAEFDRRKARQIAAGKAAVDARVDLHGLRQQDAHGRLRTFLLQAHANGCKTVLVITGKGGESSDRLSELAGERQRGVLRRNVPRWLEEPELRAIVLSFTQAAVRHGGAGALYVQLRKGHRT